MSRTRGKEAKRQRGKEIPDSQGVPGVDIIKELVMSAIERELVGFHGVGRPCETQRSLGRGEEQQTAPHPTPHVLRVIGTRVRQLGLDLSTLSSSSRLWSLEYPKFCTPLTARTPHGLYASCFKTSLIANWRTSTRVRTPTRELEAHGMACLMVLCLPSAQLARLLLVRVYNTGRRSVADSAHSRRVFRCILLGQGQQARSLAATQTCSGGGGREHRV
jgi:hypothetical protein